MFRVKGRQKFLISTALILLFSVVASLAQGRSKNLAPDNLKKFQAFDFSQKLVTGTDLGKLQLEDLEDLRGIVFGRHGRVFKEQSVQNYLAKQAWYKPNPNFDNKMLTATERKNIDLIREAEAGKHDFIQPGDLRFWENKVIAEDNLSPNTAAEWSVLLAELEAIHGKTFADATWLQKYFEERYWYKPNANYSPASLSELDRKNLATIRAARDKQRHVAVSPGDMDKFQTALLSEDLLNGATLNELRIMRDEFRARHGKSFSTPGYRAFYMWQDWYKPVKDQSKVKLNPIEEQNVKTIENYERKIRENLSAEVVKPELLEGLFAEDLRMLRNEIYARHGRIFKDAKLQKTFTDMNWYKPNPDFKNEMLSDVESKNLKTILDAEKLAESKFTEIEG